MALRVLNQWLQDDLGGSSIAPWPTMGPLNDQLSLNDYCIEILDENHILTNKCVVESAEGANFAWPWTRISAEERKGGRSERCQQP